MVHKGLVRNWSYRGVTLNALITLECTIRLISKLASEVNCTTGHHIIMSYVSIGDEKYN